ncbi:fibronectin type III domain-containing protein [Candidatus Poriferisocius sp.]|uniref:fibronectin type III domain-containing protein n=1 Tax=Candidatus Poriferisocius sp. TaxID=3101276 RepID=UPI003B52C25B
MSYEYRQKTGDGDYSPWATIIGSGATTGSNAETADTDFDGADPDFVVTGLTNGVAYQFQVRARNAKGAGAAAETQSVTIATEPGRPRSLNAVPGNGQVALSWTASSNGGSPITGWQFRLQTDADTGSLTTAFDAEPWVAIPDSNADITSYTVRSLSNTNIYRFQVRAVNAIGAGTPATSEVVNPGMPPGRPMDVAGDAGADSVTLTWFPPNTAADGTGTLVTGGSPIIRYEYSQKTGAGDYGEWTAIPATSVADTTATAQQSHTVRGLTPGTAYLFRIRAVNATGAGQPAGFADDIPVYPGTKPPAPANFSVRPVYDAASGSATVTLSWASDGDGGSPITKWQYNYANALGSVGEDAVDAATPGAQTSGWVDICDNTRGAAPSCASMTSVTLPRPDPDAAPGTVLAGDTALNNALLAGMASSPASADDVHHFVVRAVNAHDPGFNSGTDSATFAPSVPSAPRTVYISNTNPGTTPGTASVTLWWRQSTLGGSAFGAYQYAQKTGDGAWGAWTAAAAAGDVDVTTQEITGLTGGTTYTFRIRAVTSRQAPGASTESAPIAPGAPGTPGAGNAGTAPVFDAAPGTTEVTLNLTGDTGAPAGVTPRWEYSYKVGDGEYGNWTFNTNAAQFNGGTALVVDGLENGVPHTFRIRALNTQRQLSSPILTARPATPGVAPPAPQGLTASADDRSVTLSWTSGGSGGPAISRWEYCTLVTQTATQRAANPPQKTESGNCGDVATPRQNLDDDPANNQADGWLPIPRSGPDTTQYTIGPPGNTLTNGTSYTYLVRAVNVLTAAGTSTAGNGARAQANPATPGLAPLAPARVVADSGDGQVTITVDKPPPNPQDSDGSVTGYEIRKRMGDGPYDAWEPLGTSAPARLTAESGVVVSGLVNGASYTFQVRALNAFDRGAETTSNTVIPVGAPTAGELGADAGDGQVTLSWAPGTSGGSAITKWQYRMSSGNGYGAWMDIADSGADTTSHTVTGLSNGTSYTFEVRAVSQVSTSVPIESAAVTPGTVPVAPSVSAARGNGQVDVTWTAGTSAEAGPTTGWEVQVGDGAWMGIADSGADTASYSVTGLDNGTAYTISVRAVNDFGAGAAGSASATPATVPSAPEVSAERGDGEVTVSWTAGDDGGSAVTAWQLQVDDGDWADVAADATSHSVPDLTNGTSYSFSVRAVNDVGDGAEGSASATPATVPAAPEVTATAGDGEVTVSWTAGDHGGSAVTAWHLQVDDGEPAALAADASSHTVEGLDNGTSYSFSVLAVNDVGDGAAGSASATPATTPAAPTVTAVGSDGEIAVSWTAGDDGGSAVTAWHYRTKIGVGDYGDWTEAAADASSVTLSGLNSGTGALSYTFEVRGVNGVGDGEAGTSNEALPIAAPPVNGVFYSGVVTGVDFCADMSLGGARLYAHDSDGDGVADVCSLPYTRREAIARQNAVEALVVQFAPEYKALVAAACAASEGDESCGEGMTIAPPAVPINDGGPFYSGVITGPSFCANRSLGGPTTYPHDGDGDGVSDVCALPYTRREAMARQLAGDILAASHSSDFRRELTAACRGLTGADYGDDAEDLARDACA